MRVLLVDDDRTGLEVRRLIFEHAGHSVSTAASAEEARAAGDHDAVILDLCLPELEDGLKLIRYLRAAGPQARIIVLSGRIADLDRHPERELVDEVRLKPTSPALLLRAIQKPSG